MTSRASVGFFGIIDAPSCTNQGFISILPHDSWTRMYLLHNLMYRKRYERPTLTWGGSLRVQLGSEPKFQGRSSWIRDCGWPAAIFSSVLLSQA